MLTPSPGLEIVPGYHLVRRLGKGMQGEVWSADGSGGFQAAIKIVHNMEERATKRELWALASLRHVKHPNLCPLFGFWLLDGNGKVLPISIADFERTPEDSIPVGTMQLPSNAAIPGAAIPGTSDSGGVVRSGSGKSSESRRGGGSAGRGGLSDSDDFEVVDDDEVRSTTMEPTDSGSRRSGGPHGFDASRPTPGPDQDATVTAVLSPDQQNAPLGDPNAATHVALDRTSRFAEDETARVRGDTFEKISASQALDQAESLVIAMGLGDQTLGDYLKSLQKTARSGVPAPAEESSVAKFSDFKNFGKQKPAPESAKQRPPAIGIPQGELIRYLSPAADAIDFLNHQHQIFHCDIKPQNLLLVGGQTQVCDFGLASRVAIDSQKTRVSFGTPAYGAPEMVFDNAYSDNIDQYSLAITYYELRTGRLPYKSKAQGTVLVAKQTGQLDFSLATPLEVAALQRATRVDPSERFDSCTEFLNALTHPAAGRTVPGTSRVVPLTTKLLTGVSLMLLIVAGWFVWSTHLGTSISGNGQREKAELENGQREKLEQNSGEQAELQADVDRENTRAELERRAQRDAADAQRKRRAMIAGADGKLAEIETLLQTAPWPEAVPWPDPAEFESLPPAHPLVTSLPLYQTLAQWTAKTPPRKMLQWDSTRKSILDSVPDAILDAWAASVGWQIESDIAAESDWQAATEFREDALQKVVGRDRMPAPIANLLQLVRLLDIRATTSDLETNTEQILATTAAMLQPEMNPLAIAARCLVRRDRADAILDSPKIRESLRQISGDSKAATPDFAPLPETLAGVPDIGWGWLQSRTGKVVKANETWLAIVDELLQRRSLHPDDRSALAQQMVTQLIQSQGIANDDVDSLRYHSFTKDPGFLGTTKRLLTICDKLAGPAKSVKAKIWHEAYLLSVAAGDWRTADRLAGKPFQRSGQSDLADFESYLRRFGKPSANLRNAPPPLTNRWLRAAEALTRPEQPLKSKHLSRLLQPMLGILQTSASGLPEVPLFVQSDTYAVIAARLSAWLRG
ncbi:MAG: protein kinase, partial [Planctomycetota bacterium]